MDALVYNAVMHCDYQAQPEPQASHGHSIIDVSFCGICGSDMHAWHGHDSRRVPPLILGHKVVGRAVDGPYAGQLVAINPLLNCGTCATCRSGATHLRGQREMISMRLPGGMAQYVSIRDSNITALSKNISLANAALAEPLACVVHAMRLMTYDYKAPLNERMVILAAVDDAYGCDRAK